MTMIPMLASADPIEHVLRHFVVQLGPFDVTNQMVMAVVAAVLMGVTFVLLFNRQDLVLLVAPQEFEEQPVDEHLATGQVPVPQREIGSLECRAHALLAQLEVTRRIHAVWLCGRRFRLVIHFTHARGATRGARLL